MKRSKHGDKGVIFFPPLRLERYECVCRPWYKKWEREFLFLVMEVSLFGSTSIKITKVEFKIIYLKS